MNTKHIKKGIMPILTLILLFSFTVVVFPQEKQTDPVMKLREEILAVYQAKGEQGLREFFKKSKNRITNKFILDFAEEGVKERKAEWLKACEIMAEEKNDRKIVAEILFRVGKYYIHIYDHKTAMGYLSTALNVFIELNDLKGQANVYLGKGMIFYLLEDSKNALEWVDKALPLFQKLNDYRGQGNIYFFKANLYSRIGNYSNAMLFYDKALDFFEKDGFYPGMGNVYNRKGNIFLNAGNNSDALEMYDKAQRFFEKAGDDLGQGNVFLSIGDYYYIINSYSKALEMYDKSLILFKKIKNLVGIGQNLLRKGVIYTMGGMNEKAFESFNEALPFFKKADHPSGLGNAYQRIGDIYFFKGDNIKALEMYNKAIIFLERAENYEGIGNVLLRSGDIYFGTGDNYRALLIYEKANSSYKKVGNISGQGIIFQRIGLVYAYNAEYSKALEQCDKALSIYEKNGNLLEQANIYTEKGFIYFKSGNNSKAIEIYNKAITIYKKICTPNGQRNVFEDLGNIYLYIGDNLKALSMYEKALSINEKIGDIRSDCNTLHGKAKVFAKQGKKHDAIIFFERSIFKLEKYSKQTAIGELKKNLMAMVYEKYEETVLFMLDNKYYENGFKYAESMRARVFLDQMAEGLVMLEKGLKSELREERDRLVGKLSALSRQMQETGGKDEKKLQELKEEYRRIESQFEDLLIKIRLENPLYTAVNYPQPLTVRDLQTEVLKKGETLLSYFIAPDKAYAFIVSQGNLKVKDLKVNEKEINSYVQRYLQAIKGNNARDMMKYGSLLYEKLFKPLEKYLKKNREIIIVPSGKLETIPFESLIVSKKNPEHPVYLLEKYRLKYVQSASLLSILRKHYTRKGTSNSFIGFGDPVYDYENFKQGKQEQGSVKILATENSSLTHSPYSPYSPNSPEAEIKEIHRDRYARAGGIMDRLPYSGEEIKTIARLFEKQSLKNISYLREQAAEENAKAANMKDFDYIHFSCHGLLNDDFQSLVLSQLPADKSKEDGYFTLNEIMNCDYNAKLVVLSACETGSGKMYKGEGVTGLTRAVMYAGTPAVVASLWKVDDIATKDLMVNFYRNMLEKKMEKVEALRQAKLELLKDQHYRSPLYWSAFVMYGE
jgi:CHAT domain-containing protein